MSGLADCLVPGGGRGSYCASGPAILAGRSSSQVQQAGFTDTWTATGSGDGLTCCHQEDLMDATADFYERIDYILLSNNDFTGSSIEVVGDQSSDRTSGSLWPSEHAGVTATLEIQ